MIGQRFNNEDFNVQPIDNRHRGSNDQQSISYGPGRGTQKPYDVLQHHGPNEVTQAPISTPKYPNSPNDPYGNRQDNRPQRPHQVYYPPNRDQESHSNRNPNEYPENGEPKLFYPENPNGQTQNPLPRPLGPSYSTTQDPRGVDDSRNNYSPSRPSRPQQGPFPSQGSYPRPDSVQGQNAHRPYDNTQTQRPQGGPFPSHSAQDNRNDYGHGRPHQFVPNQQTGQHSHHGSQPQEGVKTTYHRPSSDQYPRPGVNQPPKDSGLELVYGVSVIHDPPESRGSIITFGPSQTHHNQPSTSQQEVYQPSNPWNIGDDDGIARTYILENGQISIIDPFGPICANPCINGVCIGQNQCMCNPGYQPDPNNPFSTTCFPICNGGCINGVCTSPNLCICKVGYTKEFGVKGSNRCILAK